MFLGICPTARTSAKAMRSSRGGVTINHSAFALRAYLRHEMCAPVLRSRMMHTDFTLTATDEHLLGRLIGTRVRQIVWDLNALYIVGAEEALKVEVLADAPPIEVRTDQYEELVYVDLETIVPPPSFRNDGEEGYWYKVVAIDEEIRGVEVARTMVCYPSGTTRRPDRFLADERGVTADVGVLVTLSRGIVPAVVCENSFGFATWPEVRVYQREELAELLREKYVLRALQSRSF
jgi:hypothetical protein